MAVQLVLRQDAMNARALPCRSLAAISSSKFVEFYICFTMHLPWLVVLPCVVSAHIRGVTSNTKFLDIQFLTEEDVDETIVLKAGLAASVNRMHVGHGSFCGWFRSVRRPTARG